MENKTGKYFKYAVGEIVLVVIGILIALSINNWNEGNKSITEELKILKQLHEEFVADSMNLYDFTRLVRKKAIYGKSLKNISDQNKTVSEDSIIFKSFQLGIPAFYDSHIPTYDEIVSSGKLGLIKSKAIKSRIRNYKQMLEFEKVIIRSEAQLFKKEYNTHLYNYFEPEIMVYFFNRGDDILDSSISLDSFRKDVSGFFKDPKTIKLIEYIIGVESKSEWSYKRRTMPRLARILDELKKEIKNFDD